MTTAEARRLNELQRQLDAERRKRFDVERKLAGTRSALMRLQAMVAQHKAEAMAARANGLDERSALPCDASGPIR